jgi:hypothetical protein|tara:strand:+ start:127 stop:660 length:534 start_codon:yes stop_codon:yes gene_type:complete
MPTPEEKEKTIKYQATKGSTSITPLDLGSTSTEFQVEPLDSDVGGAIEQAFSKTTEGGAGVDPDSAKGQLKAAREFNKKQRQERRAERKLGKEKYSGYRESIEAQRKSDEAEKELEYKDLERKFATKTETAPKEFGADAFAKSKKKFSLGETSVDLKKHPDDDVFKIFQGKAFNLGK